jgi:hypothetical protein
MTKTGWATLRAIFSQTHLVTLIWSESTTTTLRTKRLPLDQQFGVLFVAKRAWREREKGVESREALKFFHRHFSKEKTRPL